LRRHQELTCQKTRRFTITPNPAGVHFSGFEHVHFDSRTNIEGQIRAFIASLETADNPRVRVILGDWGDGKSELYERYLKHKEESMNYKIVYCAASSVNNAMQTQYYEKMVRNEVRASVRFITSLLIAIHSNPHNTSLFGSKHEPREGRRAEQYSDLLLSHLLPEENDTRLVIYIDEFEELIGQESLPEILSGIKEVINQEFNLISNSDFGKGKLAGRVHLILACTPDAFHRLPREKTTSQILGGWERRVGRIRLTPLRKREAVAFLNGLTAFYYEGKVPNPSPFQRPGMFETLHRISMGNVGNLVSLHAELLQRASSQDDTDSSEMCIVDYEQMVEWLKSIPVSVYGARESCLSKMRYDIISTEILKTKQKVLGKTAVSLLRLLLADSTLLDYDSVKELIPTIKSLSYLKEVVNHINGSAERVGLPSAIISLSRLKENLGFPDLQEKLSSTFEFIVRPGEEEGLVISQEFYSLTDLEDSLTYRLAGEEWVVCLPSSGKEASKWFGPLSESIEKIVTKRICNPLLGSNIFYALSPLFKNQFFPSPIPPGLEFIINREERLKVWRRVNQDFSKLFEKMHIHIEQLLASTTRLTLKSHMRVRGKNTSILDMTDEDLAIRVLVLCANPEVTLEDVRVLEERMLGGDSSVHLVLVLTTGGMTEEANTRVKELGFYMDKFGIERLLVVDMHPHTAKQILSMYETDKKEIDQEILKKTQKWIINEELQLIDILNSWLDEHTKIGFVVQGVKTTRVGGPKQLQEALRYFINYSGELVTPEDAFSRTIQDFQRYQIFGTAYVFGPDISSKAVSDAAQDLCENLFLEKTGRKYASRTAPTENMILKILETTPDLSAQEIGAKLVRRYKIEKTLQDLYLATLEYKGLIERTSGKYNIVKQDEALTRLDEIYTSFIRNIESRPDLTKWGVIHVSKERDSRIILIDDFVSAMKKRYENIDSERDTPDKNFIIKIKMLQRLIDYFNIHIDVAFSKAISIGTQTYDKALQDCREIDLQLKNIVSKCKSMIPNIDMEQLEETQKSTQLSNQLEDVIKVDVNSFTNVDETKFGFRTESASEIGFNPKVQSLRSIEYNIAKLKDVVERGINALEDSLSGLDKLREQIIHSTKTYKIEKTHTISSTLQKLILKQAQGSKETDSKESPINLSILKTIVKETVSDQRTYLSALSGLNDTLETSNDMERELRCKIKQLEKLQKKADIILTKKINDRKKDHDGIYLRINEVRIWLEREFVNLRPSVVSKELFQKLNNIDTEIQSFETPILDEWKHWRQSLAQEIKNLIRRYQQASLKIPDLNIAQSKLEPILEGIEENLIDQDDTITSKYIEGLFESVRAEIVEIVEENMGHQLAGTLAIISDLIHTSSAGFVARDDVVSACNTDLEMDNSEIDETIAKLIELELLVEFVGMSKEDTS